MAVLQQEKLAAKQNGLSSKKKNPSSRQKMLVAKRTKWKERIAGWEASGMSQAAFCRKKGIALHKFKYWRTKLTPAKPAIFAEIPIIKESCTPGSRHTLLIRVGDRYGVEVSQDFSPDFLGQVIRVLDGI